MEDLEITPAAPVNVGRIERILSAIAGSLILYRTVKKGKAETLLAIAGGYLVYRAVSGHCPARSLCERTVSTAQGRNINIRTHVIVSRPRTEVYTYWRTLENLPLFMKHITMIRQTDDKQSTWTIGVPGGLGTIQWDAEIVREEEGAEISWHSLAGASIENAGKINFSDTPGKGTRIDVLISYRAPLGMVGEGVSRLLTPLFRDRIKSDILSFKRHMEDSPSLSE
jgi:uncharacterized membrane protein